MQYTGKLQANGKIFDSTVGKKPFEFRLGKQDIISAFVNGNEGSPRTLVILSQS